MELCIKRFSFTQIQTVLLYLRQARKKNITIALYQLNGHNEFMMCH